MVIPKTVAILLLDTATAISAACFWDDMVGMKTTQWVSFTKEHICKSEIVACSRGWNISWQAKPIQTYTLVYCVELVSPVSQMQNISILLVQSQATFLSGDLVGLWKEYFHIIILSFHSYFSNKAWVALSTFCHTIDPDKSKLSVARIFQTWFTNLLCCNLLFKPNGKGNWHLLHKWAIKGSVFSLLLRLVLECGK